MSVAASVSNTFSDRHCTNPIMWRDFCVFIHSCNIDSATVTLLGSWYKYRGCCTERNQVPDLYHGTTTHTFRFWISRMSLFKSITVFLKSPQSQLCAESVAQVVSQDCTGCWRAADLRCPRQIFSQASSLLGLWSDPDVQWHCMVAERLGTLLWLRNNLNTLPALGLQIIAQSLVNTFTGLDAHHLPKFALVSNILATNANLDFRDRPAFLNHSWQACYQRGKCWDVSSWHETTYEAWWSALILRLAEGQAYVGQS